MKMLWRSALLLVAGIYGCGVSGRRGAPSSSIIVAVTPDAATVDLSSSVQFTATVVGNSNSAVNWMISGPACHINECGTIDAGLYTAPDDLPAVHGVTVIAMAQAEQNASGEATVLINSSVAVSVRPNWLWIDTEETFRFIAIVTGSNDSKVNWTLSGPGCAGTACGSIDPEGVYRAPDNPPQPPTFTVTATARADGRRSASANVEVTTRDELGFISGDHLGGN